MDDAKKGGENDWIPLLAGAQMIVRLGLHGAQVHWPEEVKVEANRQLLDALQSDRIMSVGYYRMFDGVWPISAKEWISLRPLISKNRLTPHGPILRPQFRPGDIDDIDVIDVNAVDIKREFANEPSMVALEQPPSEVPPMPAVKEPATITLAQGLTLLESRLPTEEAKTRLRQAFGQGVLNELPRFALDYHEAEID